MKVKYIALIIILGIISGLVITFGRIAFVQHSKAFTQYGSWRGTNDLPLNRDDLLTAQVTLFALFALPSQEAVYLFATTDEQEHKLSGENSYTILGNIHDIKAVYWSITPYGTDQFLIPNSMDRYSFNAHTLRTDSAGNYTITLSSEKSGSNWLPVQKDKAFRLTLRIYQGEADFMEHLENAHLPVIRKM